MKQTVVTIFIALCTAVVTNAQTNQQGTGKVSVKQSAEIDELVFGKKQPAAKTKEQLKAEKKAAKKAEKEAKKKAKEEERLRKAGGQVAPLPPPPKPVEVPKTVVAPKPEVQAPPKPDMSNIQTEAHPRTKMVLRKVYKNGPRRIVPRSAIYNGMRKTQGYRVQVFSGGNTREDKHAAERAGQKVKANYPSQPVYTHFHSPRWLCRVGNFLDYKKAEAFQKQLKKLGFKQVTVVKDMIIVRAKEK